MIPKTKGELLEHYAGKQPMHLRQWDCFFDVKPGQMPFEGTTDKDGDSIWIPETYDLRSSPSLRVSYPIETKPEDVIRGLKKILALVGRKYK